MDLIRDGELYLYGFVGENYWGDGFTASEVLDALTELGPGDISVHVNSGGGYTDHGIAIYNALKAHPGNVTIMVDAMAASAASLIVMAGDLRIMRAASLMMIHDPSTITWGTADDHGKSKEVLDKLGNLMAALYAARSGDEAEDLRVEMKETLWLTPEEAVERGFATGTEDEAATAVAAFDYRVYAHAPEKLCALAQKNRWSLKAALAKKAGAAATASTGQEGDKTLSKEKPAAAPTATTDAATPAAPDQGNHDAIRAAVEADRQRRADILALDEAKGREALAEKLYAQDMSAEQAKDILAAAPKAAAATDIAAYEAERASATGLAQPDGDNKPKAKIDRVGIFAARAQQVKGA